MDKLLNKSVEINNIKIYPFKSHKDLLERVKVNKGLLVAINAEKILHATDELRSIINTNIGYCDGIGAVLALRKKGYKDVIKIAGCELWLQLIESLYQEDKKFYLVGSTQPVIEKTVAKLKIQFEGINIVNFRNGYIKDEKEKQRLIRDVANKKPDVVFVAMGSPKQELLMQKMFNEHPAIYQGLGGSFDVYTGDVKRAPEWWVKHNLEFAYRLIKQPSRLKRQIHLLRFLWLLETGQL